MDFGTENLHPTAASDRIWRSPRCGLTCDLKNSVTCEADARGRGAVPELWQLTEPVAASARFWMRSGCATEGAAHAHPSRAFAGEDQAPADYETTQRWEGRPAGSE